MFDCKMDKRCPRKLKCLPNAPCPLSVVRLKALANINKNISHFEESDLPGCDFYIQDKDACYCFFKYIHDNEGKDHSAIEIAEKLTITQAAEYSAFARAISKLKRTEIYKYLKSKVTR